jgi:hypothetical protein
VARPCFIRTGRPAAGRDDDRRRCRSVRIQPRYPDDKRALPDRRLDSALARTPL